MEPKNRVTYRFGRHIGEQGPLPSFGNLAEAEKSATGTGSSNQAHENHYTEDILTEVLMLQYMKSTKKQRK